jgi:Leucine-rich repeat (LRR) protein
MKKFILVFYIVLNFTFYSFSQLILMPDTNFRNALIGNGFGSCINGNYIDSTCALVKNTTHLDITSSNVYNIGGIVAFKNLEYFDCSYNHISNIGFIPLTLKYIYCRGNQITQILGLPTLLDILDCSDNQIASFSTNFFLYSNLVRGFYCDNNLLTTLPDLPPILEVLSCSHNQLTSVPYSWLTHTGMGSLDCSYNQIDSLQQLPSQLYQFRCNNNLLTSLPNISQVSYLIHCQNNFLTSLPQLPSLCSEIDCSNNQLTTIPTLPANLNKFYCQNNQLTDLPTLPNTLRYIDCSYNQLFSLPEIPDTLNLLNCSYNPDLTCLPKLKKINSLNFSNCSINCIPNIANVSNSYPALSTLPLCGPLNSNGCDFFWNINGFTHQSLDTNCIFSSNETGLKNIHYKLFENGVLTQQEIGLYDGRYSFDINHSGNFEIKIDTIGLPFDIICPFNNSYADTINSNDSLFYNNDFALMCKSGVDVGAFSIAAFLFRPTKTTVINILAGYKAKFYGAHCTSGISGTVKITLSGPVNYIGPAFGSLTPNTIAGNVLTYNIIDFDSVDIHGLSILVQTDTFATAGQQVCIDVDFQNLMGDIDTTNNHLTNCFQVRTSFDPNDKLVYPFGTLDSTQKWLTYTINFQNTGTAEAENIYILDTLDNNLDPGTFQLLATSHNSFVQILEGSIIKFNFPNINLPDINTNEPLSHGYVQYKIKVKDNLSHFTTIENKAYIYFDYNPPVITNTVSNVIDIINITGINKNKPEVSILPNPFQEYLFISPIGNLSTMNYTVYNLFGEIVSEGNIPISGLTLNTFEWKSGVYFLKLYSSERILEKKLLKL